MVQLRQQSWQQGAWVFAFSVHEGVYDQENYPVRLTHAPATEDEDIIRALAEVVQATLQARIGSGSLAPHGQVLHWTRLLKHCEESPAAKDPRVYAACKRARAALPPSAAALVSNHF